VVRTPVYQKRGGRLQYLLRYGLFTAIAAVHAFRFAARHPGCTIHFHNLPDFVVFAGLPTRLFRSRLVLDLHEVFPEMYMSRMGGRDGSGMVKLLKFAEQASVRAVDRVVAVSDVLAERVSSRTRPNSPISIVPNVPATGPRRAPTLHSPAGILNVAYAGSLTRHNEFDVLVGALAEARVEADVRLSVYGDGESLNDLRSSAARAGVGEFVRVAGRVRAEELPLELQRSDAGVSPHRRTPMNELVVAAKAFDYAAAGIPIICPRLAGMSRMLGEDGAMFYEPGDSSGLARVMVSLANNPDLRLSIARGAQRALSKCTWERTEPVLLEALGLIPAGTSKEKPGRN
jgi:glycosyltransferase involved in cell wall biosynthesis